MTFLRLKDENSDPQFRKGKYLWQHPTPVLSRRTLLTRVGWTLGCSSHKKQSLYALSAPLLSYPTQDFINETMS